MGTPIGPENSTRVEFINGILTVLRYLVKNPTVDFMQTLPKDFVIDFLTINEATEKIISAKTNGNIDLIGLMNTLNRLKQIARDNPTPFIKIRAGNHFNLSSAFGATAMYVRGRFFAKTVIDISMGQLFKKKKIVVPRKIVDNRIYQRPLRATA